MKKSIVDYFIIESRLLKRVEDARVIAKDVGSDHRPLLLQLRLEKSLEKFEAGGPLRVKKLTSSNSGAVFKFLAWRMVLLDNNCNVTEYFRRFYFILNDLFINVLGTKVMKKRSRRVDRANCNFTMRWIT